MTSCDKIINVIIQHCASVSLVGKRSGPTDRRSLPQSRATETCSSCCDEDYCNLNCTAKSLGPNLIGTHKISLAMFLVTNVMIKSFKIQLAVIRVDGLISFNYPIPPEVLSQMDI